MKTVSKRHRWATRLFYSLTVMLVVALAGCDTGKDLPKPPAVYKTLEGEPVSLDALKGKVVLINYWFEFELFGFWQIQQPIDVFKWARHLISIGNYTVFL